MSPAMLFALLAGVAPTQAQQPKPPEMSLSEAAQKRFPQAVVVGTLLGRTVLQPLESQPILGHVDQIIRQKNGSIKVVIAYGGWLGFGSRPIAVPVEAMVLLGQFMEVVDFTPEQLAEFATFDGADAIPLATDATIKVGLARPSH